jgi:hypothetical protein
VNQEHHIARPQTHVAGPPQQIVERRGVGRAIAAQHHFGLERLTLHAAGARDGVEQRDAAGVEREVGGLIDVAQHADLIGAAIDDGEDDLRLIGSLDQSRGDGRARRTRREPGDPHRPRERDIDDPLRVDLLRGQRRAGIGARRLAAVDEQALHAGIGAGLIDGGGDEVARMQPQGFGRSGGDGKRAHRRQRRRQPVQQIRLGGAELDEGVAEGRGRFGGGGGGGFHGGGGRRVARHALAGPEPTTQNQPSTHLHGFACDIGRPSNLRASAWHPPQP